MALTMRRRIRDIRRFEKIVGVLFEEGFGYLLGRTKLKRNVPIKQRLKAEIKSKEKIKPEVRLRRTLERLGPTFIKFGQLLSVRPDLIPVSYTIELERLQDKVKPFSYNEAEKTIKEELGKPVKEIFRSFDKMPAASASISQVHKAILKNGDKVAVKVQRPDVRETMVTDIEIMLYIAQLLEKKVPELRKYSPVAIVKEFSEWTRNELDFKIESRNAVRFHRNFDKSATVKIPKVYSDYTTRKVLVLEYIDGVDIRDFNAIKRRKLSLPKIIKNGFDAIMKQVFVDGFFHADPHPGNILVLKNNKVSFVDFGIVGHFSESLKRKAIDLFYGIVKEDPDKVVQTFLDLGAVDGEIDVKNFREEVLEVIEPLKGASLKDIKISRILEDVLDIALRNNIKMPVDFVLFGKTILTLEGIALKYDPDFNFSKNVGPFIKELEMQRLNPKYMMDNFVRNATKFGKFVTDLPDQTARVFKKIQEGKIKIEIEDTDIKKLSLEIDRSSNRLAYGMIIAALILAGSLVLERIETIAYLCFALAAFLGLILFVSIAKERRLR